MNNLDSGKYAERPVADNIIAIVCFGVFAAGLFHISNRALPEPPRVSLVEKTQQNMTPGLALLQYQSEERRYASVRDYEIVVR